MHCHSHLCWMLCALFVVWPIHTHAVSTTQSNPNQTKPTQHPTTQTRAPKPQATRPSTSAPPNTRTTPTPKTRPVSRQKAKHILNLNHPLYQGILYCKRTRWRKAKAFFLHVKRTSLLQLPRADLPLLYLYLGLSYIHLLQPKQGQRALESALLLNECTRLPTDLDLSPQIREQFSQLSKPYHQRCERRRLAALRRRAVPPRRRSQTTPQQQARLAQSRGIRLAAWLVLGSGAVALGSAFVAGGMSFLAEVRRNEQPFTREGTIAYIQDHRLAEQRALVANVLFGTAGALLFTGFALQLSQLIQPPLPNRPPLTKPSPSKASSSFNHPLRHQAR